MTAGGTKSLFWLNETTQSQRRNEKRPHKMQMNSARHKKYNPLCKVCEELFKLDRPVFVTDHITPLFAGGDGYSWSNLQSLCKQHTAQKDKHDKKEYERGHCSPESYKQFNDWASPFEVVGNAKFEF